MNKINISDYSEYVNRVSIEFNKLAPEIFYTPDAQRYEQYKAAIIKLQESVSFIINLNKKGDE